MILSQKRELIFTAGVHVSDVNTKFFLPKITLHEWSEDIDKVKIYTVFNSQTPLKYVNDSETLKNVFHVIVFTFYVYPRKEIWKFSIKNGKYLANSFV